ncbi:iron-sulfur cluster biosynthesis family protein [Agrococcus versicolor]|uniref:Iron-sulfur cluster biosynthesis family protein n=1 Tax=Agrococcus versicolor TaxID=501482 RepID=A0ABP5MP37_9MICO
MLTLTETAQTIITGIVDQSDVADTGGLRISAAEGDQLNVGVAPAPTDGDQVLEAQGARVFLDDAATTALDDKVLDAAPDDAGRVTFTIAQQG